MYLSGRDERAEFSSLLFKTNFQISSDIEDTVVNIAGRQMGVGGDDSWGAPVHPEYRIPSDQDLDFEFVLSFKNAKNDSDEITSP